MTFSDDQDDAQRAFQDAKSLAMQGDYEGALAKHVWFHEHALSVHPSYYGVRLSYALAHWMDLGDKFPKALDTLKGIRDAKSARLLTCDASYELFHDVRAINEHLGESAETMSLFKRIEATNPDFAGSVIELMEPALLEAREYTLIKRYLGNPNDRLAKAKRTFEKGVDFAATSEGGDEARLAYEDLFGMKVCRLITVLKEIGEQAAARSVQADALKILDHERIRSALEG